MTDTDQISREGVNLASLAATRTGLIVREQPTSDYGIDAHFEVKEGAEATGRLIAVQIKAGQSWFERETDQGFWHYISDRHYNLWINHSLPVIIVLCDTGNDICYFEIVTVDKCVRAGECWKLLIPKGKTLGPEQLFNLVDIASPIAAASDFTICEEEDQSFASARHISIDILAHPANRSLNKPMLGAIVRAALEKGRNSTYFRDAISRGALRNRPVVVVWGYVYLREIDRRDALWVCAFQWISPDLDDSARPILFDGEPDGNGLVIDWNGKQNTELAGFFDNIRATKADFLRNVDRLLQGVPAVEAALKAVNSDEPSDREFTELQSLAKAFEESWDGSFTPPQECQRLDQAISELLATVGNAGLIWTAYQNKKRELISTQYQSKRYDKDLAQLKNKINFLREEVR